MYKRQEVAITTGLMALCWFFAQSVIYFVQYLNNIQEEEYFKNLRDRIAEHYFEDGKLHKVSDFQNRLTNDFEIVKNNFFEWYVMMCIRDRISAGCQNVLVSLGENGAALINKDHAYFGNAPKIQALNTAGAGDTMLGTFIGEKEKEKSDTAALKSAIAAGSDTASRSGLTDFKLEKYLNEIQVSEIK